MLWSCIQIEFSRSRGDWQSTNVALYTDLRCLTSFSKPAVRSCVYLLTNEWQVGRIWSSSKSFNFKIAANSLNISALVLTRVSNAEIILSNATKKILFRNRFSSVSSWLVFSELWLSSADRFLLLLRLTGNPPLGTSIASAMREASEERLSHELRKTSISSFSACCLFQLSLEFPMIAELGFCLQWTARLSSIQWEELWLWRTWSTVLDHWPLTWLHWLNCTLQGWCSDSRAFLMYCKK